jgi:hypothetical protein
MAGSRDSLGDRNNSQHHSMWSIEVLCGDISLKIMKVLFWSSMKITNGGCSNFFCVYSK